MILKVLLVIQKTLLINPEINYHLYLIIMRIMVVKNLEKETPKNSKKEKQKENPKNPKKENQQKEEDIQKEEDKLIL